MGKAALLQNIPIFRSSGMLDFLKRRENRRHQPAKRSTAFFRLNGLQFVKRRGNHEASYTCHTSVVVFLCSTQWRRAFRSGGSQARRQDVAAGGLHFLRIFNTGKVFALFSAAIEPANR